jgi:hypothetical protein
MFRSGGGWFSAFSNLVGNKQLTEADVEPALEQMKLNLIRKLFFRKSLPSNFRKERRF